MMLACLLCAALGCGDDAQPADTDTDGPTSGGTGAATSAASDDDDDDDDDGNSSNATMPEDDDDSDTTPMTTTSTTASSMTSTEGETTETSDTSVDPGPAGSCGDGGGTGEILQIELGSPERWYLIGAHDTDEPLPLVLAFHGDEGDPFMSTRYIWGSYWEQEQPPFIAVMTKCPGCTSWYQGDTSANADYVWEMLADVAANHNVDVSRIYAVGYSGGSEFLSIHGWEFQDVFAGIQFSCGGNAFHPYSAPSRDDCKVAGRVVISQDDFLYRGAQQLLARLQNEGHPNEYVDAQCSGHCCDTPDMNVGAWEWFQTVTKCDAIVPGVCAELDALPPAALEIDPSGSIHTRVPAAAGPRVARPAPARVENLFPAAVEQYDEVIAELRMDGPSPEGLRAAVAAYDAMLSTAHQTGPAATPLLRARYPELRRLLRQARQPAR